MKRKLLVVALVLVAGGCGTDRPDISGAPPSSSAPASSPAGSKAAPQPHFADLTQGSTTSVVRLYDYDAQAASAVVEPIIFMTGDAYCRTFKIKRTDGRCTHAEYVTEESHTRITVPIAATVKYYTWEGPGGEVCIDAPEKGGTCPTTARKFGQWLHDNKQPMIAVATENGSITRMAIVYTP